MDKAALILKDIIRQTPDHLSAWRLLAETSLAQTKYDEALSLLENVLSRDPQNLDALILQADVWLGQGEVKKARAQLERLAKTYPNVPLIDYHLARAYVADNDSTEAVAALREAIAAKPDYAEGRDQSRDLASRQRATAE